MADKVISQVQQLTSFWHGLAAAQLARVEACAEGMKKAEAEGLAQARLVADEGTKLVHAWLDFGAQLSRDMSAVTLEGAKRGLELFRTEA